MPSCYPFTRGTNRCTPCTGHAFPLQSLSVLHSINSSCGPGWPKCSQADQPILSTDCIHPVVIINILHPCKLRDDAEDLASGKISHIHTKDTQVYTRTYTHTRTLPHTHTLSSSKTKTMYIHQTYLHGEPPHYALLCSVPGCK